MRVIKPQNALLTSSVPVPSFLPWKVNNRHTVDASPFVISGRLRKPSRFSTPDNGNVMFNREQGIRIAMVLLHCVMFAMREAFSVHVCFSVQIFVCKV